MRVYIVTKNSLPVHVTFDEREACTMYESTVRSGHYREASVMVIPTMTEDHKVLHSAYQRV